MKVVSTDFIFVAGKQTLQFNGAR